MPLFDVNYQRIVDPALIEQNEFIQALLTKLPTNTYNRLVQTVKEAVAELALDKTKFVWTKAGALFGPNSLGPKRHIDHLWESVKKAVGDGPNCLKTVGSLLMWQIALREEEWLLYRQDNGGTDPDTGKTITVSTYWIKE